MVVLTLMPLPRGEGVVDATAATACLAGGIDAAIWWWWRCKTTAAALNLMVVSPLHAWLVVEAVQLLSMASGHSSPG